MVVVGTTNIETAFQFLKVSSIAERRLVDIGVSRTSIASLEDEAKEMFLLLGLTRTLKVNTP
jgi:hypothetical protein